MPPRALSAMVALVGVVVGGLACSNTRRPDPSSTGDVSSSLALLASAPTAVASSVQSLLLPPPSAAQPFPVPIPTAPAAAPIAPASASSTTNRVACQQACLKTCSAQSHECDQRAAGDRGELRRCGSLLIGCRSDCLRDSAPCP